MDNTSSDSLIVQWWWKDFEGDSLKLGPNAGIEAACFTFSADDWAQIETFQWSFGRGSSNSDGRLTLLGPFGPGNDYYIVRSSGPGVDPTITSQPPSVVRCQ